MDQTERLATSHIPDDPAHWDAQAARVTLRVLQGEAGALAWLASAPGAMAAALLVLAAGVAEVVPPSGAATPPAILREEAPPSIAALLVGEGAEQ